MPNLAALSLRHLRLMAELASAGQLSLAAARLGLAQPQASRMLAEIEAAVGQPVHARDGRSLRLTAAGEALSRRAARIRLELEDAAREVAGAATGTSGHVRIGAVTGPALDRVLPVIRRAAAAHPDLSFSVEVGPSETLCDALLAGRIDFALGRLAGTLRGLEATMIAPEPIDLVVRRGHPLAMGGTVAALMQLDWVLPEETALLTRSVLSRLTDLGLPAPRVPVRTGSFLFTLALLKDSDAVAPLAAPVATAFATGPDAAFTRLPLDLGLSVAPWGLLRRAGADLPPAAARIAAEITSPA